MQDINVLITGVGAPGAPGIIKSLRKNNERHINIIGVDMNPKVSGFSMVDRAYVVPKASEENFLRDVLNVCKKEKINVILPLVTKELLKFAENKAMFEIERIKICVLDNDILKIANNKGLLLEFLKQRGFEVPAYKIVKNIEEFEAAFLALGYPSNALCFKPTISNGSRGFRIVDPKIDKGNLLFNEKPNSTYISYEEIKDILVSMKEVPELIVMEYLPGEEYSIDILADEGVSIYTIPRRRDKMLGGISIGGTVVYDDVIIDYCNEIIKILKCSGNIGIQVKKNAIGKPMILEINPRVQGTIVLCTAAGVNMPYYGIKLAIGEEIPKVNINWNVEMIRYWEEVYYDNNGYAFTL